MWYEAGTEMVVISSPPVDVLVIAVSVSPPPSVEVHLLFVPAPRLSAQPFSSSLVSSGSGSGL